MGFEHLVKVLLLPNIDMVELWPLARDKFNTIDNFLGRIVEVVRDDNLVASL